MRAFAQLVAELASNHGKLQESLLREHLGAWSPQEALAAIAFLGGKFSGRLIGSGSLLGQAAIDARVPHWMAEESAKVAGDVAEAAALIMGGRTELPPVGLNECRAALQTIAASGRAKRGDQPSDTLRLVCDLWKRMGVAERVVFNRLLLGTFKSPISDVVLIKAVATAFGRERPLVARRLSGVWEESIATVHELLAIDSKAVRDPSAPVVLKSYRRVRIGECEALSPLEGRVVRVFGGMEAQLVRRAGETFIWSANEELLSHKFPEVIDAARALPDGTVLRGELVIYSEGRPQTLTAVEQRMRSKRISKEMLRRSPVKFHWHDILELGEREMGEVLLSERLARSRELLRSIGGHPTLPYEEPCLFQSWEELVALTRGEGGVRGALVLPVSSEAWFGSDGGMIISPPPKEFLAVLLYAERGAAAIEGHFNQFTMAVREGERLTPVAKLEVLLSDQEHEELDAWIQRHTSEKFGPVRQVIPEIVFKLTYEGLVPSRRHRSGITLIGARVQGREFSKRLEDVAQLQDFIRQTIVER